MDCPNARDRDRGIDHVQKFRVGSTLRVVWVHALCLYFGTLLPSATQDVEVSSFYKTPNEKKKKKKKGLLRKMC